MSLDNRLPGEARAERDELAAEHERLLEYARTVRGSRDVHSVYEVLDWQCAEVARLKEEIADLKQNIEDMNEANTRNWHIRMGAQSEAARLAAALEASLGIADEQAYLDCEAALTGSRAALDAERRKAKAEALEEVVRDLQVANALERGPIEIVRDRAAAIREGQDA